jgi:hypothetical protein
MSLSQLLQKLKRYDENAAVIFDKEEPIGRPTDLVMPRRRWFKRHSPQDMPKHAKSRRHHS